MELLTLAELLPLFPAPVNRYAHQVERATVDWAEAHGLIATPTGRRILGAVEVGLLMAHVYPTADYGELQLLADWTTWGFLWDDRCAANDLGAHPAALAAYQARLRAVLGGDVPSPWDPFEIGLADIRLRLLARLTPADLHPFLASVDRFFAACVWEAENRVAGRVPDVASYMEMRPHSGGVDTYVELFSFLDGAPLPHAVQIHPAVQRLTRMANNVVCWINDVLSLEKELRLGDVHNLIMSLRQQHALPLEAATQQAIAILTAEVRAFTLLERDLPVFGGASDAALMRYVARLRSWITGSLTWSYASGRYLVAERAVGA